MLRDYSINKKIAQVIEQKGIMQSKVAKAVNMAPETFNRIVNCKRVIFADELQPICDFIGVRVEDVLSNDFKEDSA